MLKGRITTETASVLGAVSSLPNTIVGQISFGDPYGGPYVITPNTSTQTLNTSGKRLAQDIVVNPIPSNYGLIGWDGSVLTVS